MAWTPTTDRVTKALAKVSELHAEALAVVIDAAPLQAQAVAVRLERADAHLREFVLSEVSVLELDANVLADVDSSLMDELDER